MQQGFGPASASPGGRPRVRNAFVVGFLWIIIGVVSNAVFVTLANVLEVGFIALLGQLVFFACWIWSMINWMGMIKEVKAINPEVQWWPIFIPILIPFLVTPQIAKAKQMMGIQVPARNMFLYWVFPQFALAKDVNDMAGQQG